MTRSGDRGDDPQSVGVALLARQQANRVVCFFRVGRVLPRWSGTGSTARGRSDLDEAASARVFRRTCEGSVERPLGAATIRPSRRPSRPDVARDRTLLLMGVSTAWGGCTATTSSGSGASAATSSVVLARACGRRRLERPVLCAGEVGLAALGFTASLRGCAPAGMVMQRSRGVATASPSTTAFLPGADAAVSASDVWRDRLLDPPRHPRVAMSRKPKREGRGEAALVERGSSGTGARACWWRLGAADEEKPSTSSRPTSHRRAAHARHDAHGGFSPSCGTGSLSMGVIRTCGHRAGSLRTLGAWRRAAAS